MAKSITTTEISLTIERIVKESQEFLILVSPFIRIHSRLRDIIENKIKSTDVKIFIVRRDGLETDTSNWLDKFGGRIKILIKNNLHAKCFLNEKAAVITSMNLYDYSMINNIEFGVYFEKDSNLESFNAIHKEILDLGIETVENRNLKIQVSFSDLARDFKPVSIRLDKMRNGQEILKLYVDDEQKMHVPIKISSYIRLREIDDLERIKELVNNYDLYLIENNEEKYFAFYSKV